MWAIAITSILAASIQLFAWRQATIAHASLNRIQSRWAARAGVEQAIALMALHTTDPFPDDARALLRDLAAVSAAELWDARYDVVHHRDGFTVNGPMDDASRINFATGLALSDVILEDLSLDQGAAIQDWTDEDDEPSLFGAESDYYLAGSSYKPRNGPLRSIAELELVAGVWPTYVRGEDYDLDGRLDFNENDGDRTAPEDEPDDWLDAGWSRFASVYSVDFGSSDTGLPRLHLRRVQPGDLEDRCGVDEAQAQLLKAFGKVQGNDLLALITTPLTRIDARGNIQQQDVNETITPLTDEQIRAVLAETRMDPAFDRRPGRVNINTASHELIERIAESLNWEPAVADELIYRRDSAPEGITSELEFREIAAGFFPGDGASQFTLQLAQTFCTRADVFVIASRGRSDVSDAETEIVCVVDRSTVPVRILEYREQ